MNKKLVIISSFTFLLLVSTLLLVVALYLNNGKTESSEEANQTAISPNEKDNALSYTMPVQNFSFTLNQGTVATPINGINEQFTLNTHINSDLSIESGVYFLRSDKFVITFAADPEPLPVGLGGPPLPESQVIENNINKSIKRVNYDFGIQRQMENLSIEEFTKFYYYSDSFRQGIDCGDAGFVNNFCGGMTINIKKDNKKLDLNLDIRCAAKTAEDVKYCDELVKNLTVR